MTPTPIFLLALFVAAAHSASIPERIVGGTPTNIETYPSIVQVDFRTGILWSQSCAANILTRQYLLSAAHCFNGLLFSVRNRRIRAGTSNRNTGGSTFSINRAINHPSYGRLSNDGDISVVLLSSPLTYSPTIQQTPIITGGAVLPDNMPVVHAGWGAVWQGGPSSAFLRDVTIYTINRHLCRQRYQGVATVTDNMICAGVLDEGGRDACQGDSGGPLYYQEVLVGIVSWGRGCADANFPGVSTAVASYTDWIVATAV